MQNRVVAVEHLSLSRWSRQLNGGAQIAVVVGIGCLSFSILESFLRAVCPLQRCLNMRV